MAAQGDGLGVPFAPRRSNTNLSWDLPEETIEAAQGPKPCDS